MFDVAIYTDTRAEEALDGIDGFNFQAASEGLTPHDQQVIKDHLLHRVVVGWGVDHDPVAHPPTCVCYSEAGRYYVARGRSTGMTNNGRPGNLLTQVIVTGDSQDFAQFRPPQLFGAVRWNLEKAPSKQIDQWAAPLEIAPEFASAALCAMVRDDPWATDILPAFLTMVEQAHGREQRRLIVMGRDPDQVMRWMALGSLFVDAERAFALTIRGMVPDPMVTRGDIVGTSPEFDPGVDARVKRLSVNVIDLDDQLISEVEVSASASLQAKWFVAEDSERALRAIDLARSWESFLAPELATQAAALASFPVESAGPAEWATVMRALVGLAQNGRADDLFFYGEDLIDACITHLPSSGSEIELAAQATTTTLAIGCPDIAIGILLPSLEAAAGLHELTEPWSRAIAERTADVPALVWEDPDARSQAEIFLDDMVTHAEAPSLPGLFTAMTALSLDISPGAAVSSVDALARYWLDDPRLTAGSGRWKRAKEVRIRLSELLVQRLDALDRTALDALLGGEWDWLADYSRAGGSLPSQLMSWLHAAALARLSVTERTLRLSTDAITLPPQSWGLVWAGLILPRDAGLLDAWVATHGALTFEAAAWLADQLERVLDSGHDATRMRALLCLLARPGLQPPEPRLARLALDTALATKECDAALRAPAIPNRHLRTVAGFLPRLTPLLVDQIGQIILTVRDRKGVQSIVDKIGDWARVGTLQVLRGSQGYADPPVQAVTSAVWLLDQPLEGPSLAGEEFLLGLVDSREGRESLARARSAMSQPWAQRLDEFEENARHGRLGRAILRGQRRVFGKPGEDN